MKKTALKGIWMIVFIAMGLHVYSQVAKRIYYADENLVPDAHPMDFTHLTLQVSFEPESSKVVGNVLHDFTVLTAETDTLFIHGIGITISEAELDGKTVDFTKVDGGFVFKFQNTMHSGEKHRLGISYTAEPIKGIYFIGWNDPTGRCRKQIWTQGQGIDNRHWIPMYDLPNDKITTDIYVDMDKQYQVLSNGVLESKKNQKDGKTKWHYRMKDPHATYLIMLGIGDYKIKKSKSSNGTAMNFYYYPDWEYRVNSTYKYSEDMMRFMEEETWIAYPWPSYSQIPVQDFIYGAMENTSATIFGDFFFVDDNAYLDQNYVRVNAHELAHQWFGDYVTARTSAHTWLQESFATHYDLSYQRIAFGQDYFDWARRQATLSAIEASKTDLKPLAHSSAGTARHYPKGSYVLQMLRDVAGNDNFKKAINYYLQKHAFGNVDSEDLLVAFHESTGLSLDWFWEEWIYKGGEPHYKVGFEKLSSEKGTFGRFSVEQIHEINELTGLFKMPIDFEIHFTDGTSISKNVMVEKTYQTIDVPIVEQKQISYVLFDPGSKVMKTVDFKKSDEMLFNQALSAKSCLDRYDAVVALRETPFDEKKVNTYKTIFERPEFHAVRTEILRQSAADISGLELWHKSLSDKDVEVRKQGLGLSNTINPLYLNDYEKLLKDSSYEIVEMALEMLCKSRPDDCKKYLDQTAKIDGAIGKNVRAKWLALSYLQSSDQVYLDELVDLTSNSFEFRTRMNAANELKSLNYLDRNAVINMFNALFSFNARLRNPIKDVLAEFALQPQHRELMQQVISEGNWNELEKRRLNLLHL